jgi:APA family basic amino acid/polyamine antiporter
MGAMTAAGALCYAELTTRLPRAGGAYVFLREGFGRRTAFVYGWMAMLVMDPGITAALGIGLAQYLLATVGASPGHARLVAILCIVAFGLVASLGLGLNARLLRWMAAVKLAIVGVLIVAGAMRMGGTAAIVDPVLSPDRIGLSALAGGVIAAFFAFGGWWDLGRMSEEVESPRRTMPIALVGGVALVTSIYVLVTVTFILAAPSGVPGTDEAFVAAVGSALFGPGAGRVLSAMVVVTVSGSLGAVLLGAPRTYLAMARDGLLPPRLTWFDARRGSSPLGTVVQVGLACALVMLGSFNQILGYFVPAAVLFLGLSAASLLRLERPPLTDDVFRAPLYPLPLIVFLSLIAVMLMLFVAGQPTETSLGALVVLLGLAVSRFVI